MPLYNVGGYELSLFENIRYFAQAISGELRRKMDYGKEGIHSETYYDSEVTFVFVYNGKCGCFLWNTKAITKCTPSLLRCNTIATVGVFSIGV